MKTFGEILSAEITARCVSTATNMIEDIMCNGDPEGLIGRPKETAERIAAEAEIEMKKVADRMADLFIK